jgi:hypothetical protein
VVGPVFVIVWPAKTAKLEVVPRFTVGWAAITLAGAAIITNSNSVSSNGINLILLSLFIGLLPLHLFIPTNIYFYQSQQYTCHLFILQIIVADEALPQHLM